MVRKKKTATEDEKPAEKVEETAETPKEEPELAIIEEDALIVFATDKVEDPKVVQEPKAAFIDETTKLTNLLGDAPAVPLILNIEDAVKFVDRYRVWKNRVKAEIG